MKIALLCTLRSQMSPSHSTAYLLLKVILIRQRSLPLLKRLVLMQSTQAMDSSPRMQILLRRFSMRVLSGSGHPLMRFVYSAIKFQRERLPQKLEHRSLQEPLTQSMILKRLWILRRSMDFQLRSKQPMVAVGVDSRLRTQSRRSQNYLPLQSVKRSLALAAENVL